MTIPLLSSLRMIGLALALAAYCVMPAGAQFPKAAPQETGLDPAKLEAAVAIYRKAAAADKVMRGALLVVVKDGRVVLEEGLGWYDVEARLPFTPDTVFHLASNTKAYIGAAAQILVEEGRLRLDDPVERWIPAFGKKEFAGMTVEHLLTHTSGLPGKPILLSDCQKDSTLRAEAARFAKELKLVSKPGEAYLYSNAGYNVLGAVVEAASNQSLAVFLRTRIFEPLGMENTWCHEPEAPPERLGPIYRREGDGWRREGTNKPRYPIVRASGGLISSARDQMTWVQMFLDGGQKRGTRLLSEAGIQAILTPRVQLPKSVNSGYGGGWIIHADGSFSHGGSDGTYVWADPNTRMFALMFTQSPSPGQPRAVFCEALKAAVVSSDK
jgi:CubicO group peptidase (beta-lactamase class C family)